MHHINIYEASCTFKLNAYMGEWTESSSGEEKESALPSREPAKKLKLSNKEPSGEHWHFISDGEDDLGKKFMPKNMAASTEWALANFNAWRQSRNKRFSGNPEKQVPVNFLEGTDDPAALCKWLTLYVAEMRKQDGSKYPPKTLYSLLTGLLRHSHAQNLNCPNFLDNHDHRFDALHNAVDNVFRKLRHTGVGSETKSTITDTRSMQ